MTTEEDIKDEPKTADDPADEGKQVDAEERAESTSLAVRSTGELSDVSSASDDAQAGEQGEEDDDEEGDYAGTPAQLGAQRFVYAAYFTGAVAIAFLLSKAFSFGWTRLNLWKPQIGEPDEMTCVVTAALAGAGVAFYYYRDEKTRTLAEEVASELGKVTWPSRDDVVNGTFVVLVTTLVATAFFALMDRFWGFVTNLVYGAGA